MIRSRCVQFGLVLFLTSLLHFADDAAALRKMMPGTSRIPGAAANVALQEEFATRFAESGFEHGSIKFNAATFTPGPTTLTINGRKIPIDPMHPTMLRPGNFAARSFDSTLVYLGSGLREDIERANGVRLDGAIALLDYNCGEGWRPLMRFGLRGIIFMGAEKYLHNEAREKIYNTEVAIPRFFVEREVGQELKTRCTGRALPIHVDATPSRWQTKALESPWVLIPGSDEELGQELVVFTAPLDANSITPGRAWGASTIINPYVLMRMFEALKANPPRRSVLLVAVNGHTLYYQGERHLAWHMRAERDAVEGFRDQLAKELRIAELYADNYAKLELADVDLPEDDVQEAVAVLWNLVGEREDPTAPIDLSTYDDAAVRAAVDATVQQLEDEKESLLAKINENEETRKQLAEDLARIRRWQDREIAAIRRILRDSITVFKDEQLLENWRVKLDDSTGVRLPIKGELQNEAKRNLNKIKLKRMGVARSDELSEAEKEERLKSIDALKEDATKVLVLFNKIDVGIGRSRTRYRQIASNAHQLSLLRQYRKDMVTRYRGWYEELNHALKLDSSNDAIRAAVGARRVALVINLNMNSSSDKLGFVSQSRIKDQKWVRGFGSACVKLAHQVEGGKSIFVETLTNPSGKDQRYFFASTDSPAGFFQASQNTPAVALKNVFGQRGRTFSPSDDLARLDQARVLRHSDWLLRYFRVLLDDPEVMSDANLKYFWVEKKERPWSTLIGCFTTDEFSGKTTPDQEVPGCIIALYQGRGWWLSGLQDTDVINCYPAISGRSGHAIIYGIVMGVTMEPVAYHLRADGHMVDFAVDRGRVQGSKEMDSNINRDTYKKLPMFPCNELVIYNRADTSRISANNIRTSKYWIMNAASESDPQKYGIHGANSLSRAVSHPAYGPVGVYVWRKDERFEPQSVLIITNEKRPALNSTVETPRGTGFTKASELGPDFYAQVVDDLILLNKERAGELKGVSNQLVTEFIENGEAAAKRRNAAKKRHNHTEYAFQNALALGNLTKAADQMREMKEDMLISIILYMALMIPFCFFLQKLLFNFTKLEHEILGFGGVFASIYVLFRLIHPAFQIAENPEAIFIAFILGAIGVFSTWALHNYFASEMNLLFSTIRSSMGQAKYAVVGQTALLLGVQNMRRRRVRTTLTTATIILIVFTMLAFSSVSTRMKPTILPKDDEAPYTGFFYHRPAGKNMDGETAHALQQLFGGRADVIVRRTRRYDKGFRLSRPDDPERIFEAEAFLGLPTNDVTFLETMPVVEGRYFSADDAREMLLSVEGAEVLGIRGEDLPLPISFQGFELQLVGLVDDERLTLIRDLNDKLPLIPFKEKLERGGEDDQQTLEIAEEQDVQAISVEPSSLVILPEGLSRYLGGSPFCVSIRYPRELVKSEKFEFWKEIDQLLTIVDKQAKFFVSNEEPFRVGGEDDVLVRPGVHYISSSYDTSFGGFSRLLIPLIIAGSIMLNTLLGAVYERKNEIAIYNAIGLNPTHIFLFFLAEALVYSVLGSVGGYLIGQFMAIGLKASGLFTQININFGSRMVMFAILFTIVLVLLSTLYPAWVATRTAVPSGKRSWTMPEHDGQTMSLVFPFVYQSEFAVAVIFYLYEHFSRFSELSLGDMTANFISVEQDSDEQGRDCCRLSFLVALAPFDLGVTQRVTFETRFDDVVGSYRLNLTIDRVSGQDTNWVTTNKPFLNAMRKLLLQWRNIDPTHQHWYGRQGQRLLEAGREVEVPEYEPPVEDADAPDDAEPQPAG